MTYYFAYGSNMDQGQMKERCPESILVGKRVLKGYKIGFTIFSPKRKCGCADVLKSQNSEVWGLLYSVTDSDLENLDKAEAHPDKYRRFQVTVQDEVGNSCVAETYQVVAKEGDFLKPSKDYLGIMQDAAKRFDFPENYRLQLDSVLTLD